MTGALALEAAPLAAALACLALMIALAVSIVMTRALFAVAILFCAFGALASLAALVLGAPLAALALAALAAGLAPVLLLGAVLLSARTAKPRRRPPAVATPLAVVGVVGLTLWSARDLGAARAIAAPVESAPALWLAALALAAGLGAFALLAFGERGALGEDAP